MKPWMDGFRVISRQIVSVQYILAVTSKGRNLSHGSMNPTLCNIIHLEATIRFAVRLCGETIIILLSFTLRIQYILLKVNIINDGRKCVKIISFVNHV